MSLLQTGQTSHFVRFDRIPAQPHHQRTINGRQRNAGGLAQGCAHAAGRRLLRQQDGRRILASGDGLVSFSFNAGIDCLVCGRGFCAGSGARDAQAFIPGGKCMNARPAPIVSKCIRFDDLQHHTHDAGNNQQAAVQRCGHRTGASMRRRRYAVHDCATRRYVA